MDNVEIIAAHGQILCYVIRENIRPEKTIFITEPDNKQQVGFIVYPKESVIARHVHKPIERRVVGTGEVLILRKGQCQLEAYDDQKCLVKRVDLYPNDVIVLVGGGHGFRVQEDTVLLEIKQGPYLGVDDKEVF